MAVAIHGLDAEAVRGLTVAMLESGEQWDLAADFPRLADKHSTGGVADTVSLVLGPLLAACGVPVVMLTGRGLGHTMGTTDKLEAVPGLSLELDRARLPPGCSPTTAWRSSPRPRRWPPPTAGSTPCATRRRRSFDPADHRSILSKKLATGAAGLVFDVKTGNGAFLPRRRGARAGHRLVATCRPSACRRRRC
jgi:thymidine phosphorylase